MSIVLIVVSPRVPVGLLGWSAWAALREADVVLAADPDPAWLLALEDAGVEVRDVAGLPVGERAGELLTGSDGDRRAVWFGSADGDPGLTDALAEHLARRAVAGEPPEVELITGSHDVPGSRLLDLVAVMDRLRSPGGCPWDGEQTHRSLLPYLLEESYELIEAVEGGDRDHVREELGDVLMQVAFHARIAEEHAEAPYSIDDVAAGIVEKLVRRHPHVFSDTSVQDAREVERNWETIKAEEKQRQGLFEGIPAALPALARAQKMFARARRAGRPGPELGGDDAGSTPESAASAFDGPDATEAVAEQLIAAVWQAEAAGVDAESALRAVLTRWAASER